MNEALPAAPGARPAGTGRAYDVAIAGAGPAGSIAALLLARGGARVVVCDRAAFPRDKLCGGFLSGESVALLRGLGLDSLFAPREHPEIDRLVLTSPTGRSLETALPPGSVAWGVSRRVLDERLLEAAIRAGAEFQPETEAVEATADGLQVQPSRRTATGEQRRTLRAARVIAADGRDSRLARTVDEPASRAPARTWGFQAFFTAPAMRERTVEIHFFSGGYIGLQPVGDGLFNACGLVRPSSPGEFPPGLDDLVAELGRRSPAVADRFRSARRESPWHAVGSLRFGPRSPVAGPVLVTGDAAGSIEPFTGEGMSLALATGLLAARTILDGGGADAYAARWRSTARARLLACRALAAIAARDGLRDAGLSILARAPALARALVTWTRTRPVADARP